jgi:hypothetical protein
MKKSKEIYLLQDNLLQKVEDINSIIYTYIKNIKKEYKNNLIEEKNKLLLKIAEGEKLDINVLKKKYLKLKEQNNKNIIIQEGGLNDEELLDMVMIDNIVYYYENKENGIVYNKSNKIVGSYENSKIILNNT